MVMLNRYKYKLFNKRKEILNYNKTLFNYWKYTRRNNQLRVDDGYYLLFYDYFENLRREYGKLSYGRVWHFYRDYKYELNFFTVKLPNTKETLSENYLDSISEFSFKYYEHTITYYMYNYLLKSPDNHSIFAVYYPSCNASEPEEIRGTRSVENETNIEEIKGKYMEEMKQYFQKTIKLECEITNTQEKIKRVAKEYVMMMETFISKILEHLMIDKEKVEVYYYPYTPTLMTQEILIWSSVPLHVDEQRLNEISPEYMLEQKFINDSTRIIIKFNHMEETD